MMITLPTSKTSPLTAANALIELQDEASHDLPLRPRDYLDLISLAQSLQQDILEGSEPLRILIHSSLGRNFKAM